MELPQHNKLSKAFDPESLVRHASLVLNFDLESARVAKRIWPDEKEKRDMLVFMLWKAGRLSNKAIGALVGVTYSAVSKIVICFDASISADKGLGEKVDELNSQFKV